MTDIRGEVKMGNENVNCAYEEVQEAISEINKNEVETPKSFLHKIIKFCLTGGLNTLVDFVVFFVLFNFVINNKFICQFISYSAGTLNSYIVNRSWTFRSKGKFLGPEMIKFIIVNLISLGVSLIIINLGYNSIGKVFSEALSPYISVNYDTVGGIVGKILATGGAICVNFIGSNFWVFRQKNIDNGK